MQKVKVPRTPRPKVKRKLAAVRINKCVGTNFENVIFKFFTEYLRGKDIKGLVYKMPEGRNINQMIDILIDSSEFGYIGIECKSIDDSKLVKEKINLKTLSRKSKDYGHQFRKQHIFLEASGRFGIIAFEFSARNIIILVPHQYVYEEIEKGTVSLTISELIKNSYWVTSDNPGSLKLFIHNKCRTKQRGE